MCGHFQYNDTNSCLCRCVIIGKSLQSIKEAFLRMDVRGTQIVAMIN